MRRFLPFFALATLFLLSACSTPSNQIPQQADINHNYVDITFQLDPNNPSATAQFMNSFGSQALEDATNDRTKITLTPTALAVTNVTHNTKRYISATFEVTNNTGKELPNLFFLARDAGNDKPFKELKAFDGSAIGTVPSSMLAADAKIFNSATNQMEAHKSDYQKDLDINGSSLSDKTGVFPYGFLTQNLNRTSTTIANGAKGRVTFSAQLDDLADKTQDPFSFRMTLYMASDDVAIAKQCGGTTGFTCISAIQGTGATSPLENNNVTVKAVVTAVYPELKGFYIQEEASDMDDDSATSEGIWVYENTTPSVSIGDLVTVAGTVEEKFETTQISSPTITKIAAGNVLPTPVSISLPVPAGMTIDAFYEQFEGMLATFTDTLTVTEYYQLARFGQIVLSQGGRLRQYTDGDTTPTAAEYSVHQDMVARRSVILEDDRNGSNVFLGGTEGATPTQDSAYPYPEGGFSNSNYFRGGDTIDDLTVIVDYEFEAWRFRPIYSQYDYTFTKANARSATPPTVGTSNVKVASFNVLNYFTTLDSRGANSTAELRRQEAKIVAAICALDADVVGLIEIENDNDRSLNNLVNALNTGVDADGDGSNDVAACAQPYTAVSTGKIGTDEIAVAFIYRASTVSLQGSFATLTDATFLRPNGGTQDRNRPALAQSFRLNTNNGIFTVVVNHLKSKGGTGSGADADQNDGQANYNSSRTKGAQALMDWLATDPTSSGDSDVLVIGDLNAYRYEDPVQAIRNGSDDTKGTSDDFVDVITAADTSLYSYVFSGQVGFLDHALASSSLNAQVTGATIWNINADEVNIFDYNDDVKDANEQWFYRKSTKLPVYEANVYRASDHDPVLVGLSLNADTAPPADTTAPTVQSLSPADDATNVAVESNLELTFSENISKGTGNITLHKASDNSVVETIDVTSGQVAVSGNKATINPNNDLANTTDYYVTVAAGSFKDAANNTFAGITDTTTWNFTTAAASSTTTALPWINELHYDNSASGDGDEFIEIIVPNGVSITNLEVVLYNGTSSQRSPYSTIPLSSFTSVVSGNHTIYTNSPSSIQNGSPDGLALCDNGAVVGVGTANAQFLSYEGTFTAASGCADTLTSVDIGVAESNSNPDGLSLQLSGSGSSYSDFNWTGPVAATKGSANTGQTLQ